MRRWIVALLAMLMVGAMASPALAHEDGDDDDERTAAASEMADENDDDDDDDDEDDDDEVASQPVGTENIVDLAIDLNATTQSFDLLIGALMFAKGTCGVDLLTPLSSPGNFTVFAPTDDAFLTLAGVSDEGAALDAIAAALTVVYGDACEGLIDVLTYHVSAEPGEWDDDDEIEYDMLNGDEVEVEGTEVEDEADQEALIVAGPVDASNGRIFAVDKVLLPEQFDD